MRISKRIAATALAGVLACSLAAAPLAMAAEGGLLSGLAGAGAETAAAAAVEGTQYEIHTYGKVAVQMPAEWDIYEESFEGESYGELETDTAMLQIMQTAEVFTAEEQEALVAQCVEELQYLMADYAEAANEAFYLDGVLVRNIVATGTYEGVPVQGLSSLVFGDDWTFVMLTVQFDAGEGFDPDFAHAHATLAVTEAAAAPAPAEAVAYETHAYGQVAVQMPAGWDVYEEVYEGEAYGQLETETAMLQVMVLPEAVTGADQETLVVEGVAELQYMMADYVETANETFTIDGVLFRDIVATGTYEGVPVQGFISMAFGEDWTFAMLTVQFDAGEGFDPALARAHATLGIAAAQVVEPETAPVTPAAEPEPVAPETATTEPAAPAPAGTVEAAEFVIEGWTIAAAGEPAVVVNENEWSDYYGMEAVAIPVNVTNTTGSPEDPWTLSYTLFGANGVEALDWGFDFEDSLNNVGKMRPDASATLNLYMPYVGEGVYTVMFTDWETGVQNTVTATLGTPAPAAEVPAGGFVCDGWTIVPGEGYSMGVVEDEWSDAYGMEVVVVPMTIYNGTGEISSPWWDLYTVWYGAAGVEVDAADWDFADSFMNLGNMMPGAVAECCTYFLYEGDGEYVMAFEGWDDDSYNEIIVNVVK